MAALGRRAPRCTDTPSDVPSTLDSMSWVAKPLPANSTSIQPSRTRRGDVGPGAGVDDGRPAHGQHLARPRPWPARMRVGHVGHEQRLGLLRRHLRGHELERARRRGAARAAAPARRRCRPRPGRRSRTRCIGDGAGTVPSSARRARSPSPGSRRRPSGRRPAPRSAGWWWSRSRRAARRRDRRRHQLGVGLHRRGWPRGPGARSSSASSSVLVVGASTSMRARLASVLVLPMSTSTHAVVGAGGEDHVQHLGQDQRVDDVALDLDDLDSSCRRRLVRRLLRLIGHLVGADVGSSLSRPRRSS